MSFFFFSFFFFLFCRIKKHTILTLDVVIWVGKLFLHIVFFWGGLLNVLNCINAQQLPIYCLKLDHRNRHVPNNMDQLAFKYMVRSVSHISSPHRECSCPFFQSENSRSLAFDCFFPFDIQMWTLVTLFSVRRCVKWSPAPILTPRSVQDGQTPALWYCFMSDCKHYTHNKHKWK